MLMNEVFLILIHIGIMPYYVGLYDDNDNAGQNEDYLYTDPYSYEITNEYLPDLHDWGLPSDNCNQIKLSFLFQN